MALTCDNCTRDAQYTTADPGVNPANYCVECLPPWLHERAQAGHFPLVSPITEATSTAAPSKKKPAAS